MNKRAPKHIIGDLKAKEGPKCSTSSKRTKNAGSSTGLYNSVSFAGVGLVARCLASSKRVCLTVVSFHLLTSTVPHVL